MERIIGKPTVVIVALLAAFALALALAPQAIAAEQESELQAAPLATQAAAGNTTKNKAAVLALGKTMSAKFSDYQEHSNYYLADYWYKFKTTNRNSAYLFKAVSIDGHILFANRYDAKGNESEWTHYRNENGGISFGADENLVVYKNDAAKRSWLYFKISAAAGVPLNTRYKLTVSEHPLFKTVTGVKASKKTRTSLTLKWTNQKNVTKYQVKYRAKGGKWQYKTVAKNALTLKKLKKNTRYQVMVRAYCKKGFDTDLYEIANWSWWSNTKTLKTAK